MGNAVESQFRLSENLSFLLEKTCTSLAQLHRETKIALSNIKRMKHDQHCNPTLHSLLPIADYFSVTINQLVGIDPLPGVKPVCKQLDKRESWLNIPLLNWHEAHLWPKLDYAQYDTISTDAEVSLQSFALVVQTNQWEGFQEGSYLVVDPQRKASHANYTLLHKQGQPISSLKQFLENEGMFFVKPVDTRFPSMPFSENFQQVGTVAQIKVDF